MKTVTKLFALLLLLLAACTPAATQPADTASDKAITEDKMTDEAMADESMAEDKMTDEAMTDEAMTDEAMTDEAMTEDKMDDEAMADEAMTDETMTDEAMTDEAMTDKAMADLPLWQQITLTDVRTNETFTLADFAGKTVYVEPMATWCTNCRQQFGNVQEAKGQLNDDNIVFVGISVETNIDNATLAEYVVNTGFDWPFAVATPEMLQSLADQFGHTVANPPATPHFVISPDGTVSELLTGFSTPEEIIGRLQG